LNSLKQNLSIITSSSSASSKTSIYPTTSLKFFPALNLGTFLAGICISFPLADKSILFLFGFVTLFYLFFQLLVIRLM